MEYGMSDKGRDGWRKCERLKMIGGCLLVIAQAVWLVSLVLMLSGCTTTRYVPVEKTRTEYRDRMRTVCDTVRDTIIRYSSVKEKDSVTVRRQGDTVYVDRWRTVCADRYASDRSERTFSRADSAAAVRSDSVRMRPQKEGKQSGGGTGWQSRAFFAVQALALAVTFVVIIMGYWKRRNK